MKSSVWWFVCGRERNLSIAEIKAVMGVVTVDFLTQGHSPLFKMMVPRPETVVAKELMHRLGGTVKIALELGSNLSEEELFERINEELKTIAGKIHCGLSAYRKKISIIPSSSSVVIHDAALITMLAAWGKKIKEKLKADGYSVRYVESREEVLSSVTVEKNGLTQRGREFLIEIDETIPGDTRYALAKTLAVQPFAAFGARDFGRPGRDEVSGMLPPKLALTLINLSGCPKDKILFDPFCGSGTIITEAWLQGYSKLIGSDLSDKAVADTEHNLEWIKKEHASLGYEKTTASVFQADVKDVGKKIATASVTAVVAEPYMGKPLRGSESRSDLETQAKELKKLYLEAFRAFHTVLKTGGKVIFLVPRFRLRSKLFARKELVQKEEWVRVACVEDIKKLGFVVSPLLPDHDFILYARPNQHVGREVWCFEKK